MSDKNKVGPPKPPPKILNISQETHWQGPIPPPQILHQFETIQPGSMDRILTMAEQNQAAMIQSRAERLRLIENGQNKNHELQMEALRIQMRRSYLSTGLTALLMLGGIGLVWIGAEPAGIASIFSAIAAILGALFISKKKKK